MVSCLLRVMFIIFKIKYYKYGKSRNIELFLGKLIQNIDFNGTKSNKNAILDNRESKTNLHHNITFLFMILKTIKLINLDK